MEAEFRAESRRQTARALRRAEEKTPVEVELAGLGK
jgi:hypothetical protein